MLNLNTINLFLGVGVCSIWRHKFVCFRKQGRVSYIVQAPLKDSLGTNLDYLFYLSHFQKWQLSQLKRSKQNKQKTHMPSILRPSLLCFVSTKYIRIMMPVLIIFILKDRGEKEIIYLHINNLTCFNSNCLFYLTFSNFCAYLFLGNYSVNTRVNPLTSISKNQFQIFRKQKNKFYKRLC